MWSDNLRVKVDNNKILRGEVKFSFQTRNFQVMRKVKIWLITCFTRYIVKIWIGLKTKSGGLNVKH